MQRLQIFVLLTDGLVQILVLNLFFALTYLSSNADMNKNKLFKCNFKYPRKILRSYIQAYTIMYVSTQTSVYISYTPEDFAEPKQCFTRFLAHVEQSTESEQLESSNKEAKGEFFFSKQWVDLLIGFYQVEQLFK